MNVTFKILLCLLALFCPGRLWLGATPLRVAQLVAPGEGGERGYPHALSSLLESVATTTGAPLEPSPLLVESLQDPRLFQCPLLYVNWDDREDWERLPEGEVKALQGFLEGGGFLWLDAGIAAEFLRKAAGNAAQHHSYGEWQVAPAVQKFMERVLPQASFQPIPREDPLFRPFYQGLPDTSLLPPTVQRYIAEEKWPGGTYSVMGIRLEGRLAVIATPILAMGWGRNSLGAWTTDIQLRTLERGDTLGEILPQAAVLGPAFAARREDGTLDQIYCQQNARPAWLREPTGQWRLFRYHDSRQISDFTHLFYSRLGINFILAALLGE